MTKNFINTSGSGKVDNVVHVLNSLDFGGVESHMKILAKTANNASRRHSFCAISRLGATADQLAKIGISAECLYKSSGIPSFSAVWALFRFFRRLKPTVVHTHGAEANFHGLIAAWFARVPVRVGEEIGLPVHSKMAKWGFRQVYRLAHRVVGISDSVAQWLVDNGEVPANKAVRIYNPVELPTNERSTENREKVKFRIGFVGRLEKVKNPVALIEAVATLLGEGIPGELWLVGDGSQRQMLERRARELQVSGQVTFFGYQGDPSRFIGECDVYVQPSLSEGFGLALVEAMGCGVPVVATAVGGAPEIIEHGRTGWLVDEPTPFLIAKALREAWGSRGGLKNIGQAGREAVLSRFDPAAYLQELESLYLNIIRGVSLS